MAKKYLDETGVTYLWNKIKNEDYKSEYNLGYYDTITTNSDGTYTITRQTGYLDSNDLLDSFIQVSWNSKLFEVDIPLSVITDIGQQSQLVNYILNDTTNYIKDNVYSSGSNNHSVTVSNDKLVIKDTSDDINILKQYLSQHTLIIQYKLATAITEKVEKNHYATYNQTFILEHNKNEAERSANLYNWETDYLGIRAIENCTVNSNADGSLTITNISGTRPYVYFVLNDKKYLYNQKYTISYISNNSSIISFTELNNIRNENQQYTSSSKNSNGYWDFGIEFKSNLSGASITISNIMLNEGSVALPYQPYEGKVVHEKELDNYRKNIYTTSLDANAIYNSSNYYGYGITNAPTSYGNLLTFQYSNKNDIPNFAIQLFLDQSSNTGDPSIYIRGSTSDAYRTWKKLAFVDDIPTFKTINGNSIVGSGDMSITADSVFTEVTDVIDTFTINRNGTWLITCLGYNKIYASDNSTISFYGSALVSMTSAGSDPHICINGTAYACSSAITFVTSGILQVYKKAN